MPAATRRQPGRALAAVVVLAAVLPAALLVGLAATLLGAPDGDDSGCDPSYGPSRVALGDIPGNYLRLYRSAAAESGLGWEYLAAIGSIESDHGRLRAPGVRLGSNRAGAQGPMQFLGSTWTRHGVDGDRDGRRSPYDPADAIPAAAGYLRASGAPEDYGRALFAYNHASWYVADVKQRASQYRGAAGAGGSDQELDDVATGCGVALALGQANGRDVLSNPRIEVYPGGRADLQAGIVDPGITALLEALARTHSLTVSSLTTGHSIFTASGNRSNHADGRAVDIAAADGRSCRDTSRTAPCGRIASELARITGRAVPSEVIYCFDPGPGSNSWAAADHCDHVHVGIDP